MNRSRLRARGYLGMAAMAISCFQSVWAQTRVFSPASAKNEPGVTVIPAGTRQTVAPERPTKADTGSWIIGARATTFELLDDTRGTPNNHSFMGTITKLETEEDDMPNKLFVQYRLVKSPFWIGLSYDHVRAKTMDYGGSDGSVDLTGYIPYVQARWENKTQLTPYLEAGVAFYEVDFDEDSKWYAGGQRTVELDDRALGMEMAGGVAFRIYKGLSLDFYARYMNVEDVTGAWYDFGERFGDVIFTMSHVAYGIGAQYRF